MIIKKRFLLFLLCIPFLLNANQKVSLVYFTPANHISNFGDALSPKIVERIIKTPLIKEQNYNHQMLAIGSILHFAKNDDIIWGSGLNGKIAKTNCTFSRLDVRAVRGPLTRKFLLSKGIKCPEIYGDPALLMPLLFPELKANPQKDYIVIPNLNEMDAYKNFPNLVLPTEECMTVVKKILEAKLVISGSLHGIIVAEAFGIPARLLRITTKEHIFKYKDYYLGTNRPNFKFATSIEEALQMGGEPMPVINLKALLESFPYDQF
jgi:pyruvyltransferase